MGDELLKQLIEIAKKKLGEHAFIALMGFLAVALTIFYLASHPDVIEALITAAVCIPVALGYVWIIYRKQFSRNFAALIFIFAIFSLGAWAIWLVGDLTSTQREIARSLTSGQESMRDKDYASAEKHFEDARDLANTSKSSKGEEVKSLFLLGQTQILSGQGSPEQVKKAQDNFESAFDLAGDNLNMKARVRVAQAEIASDNDQARQYLSEALEFSGEMKDHDSYLDATILRAQGDLENGLLNRDQAILDYRNASEAYRKSNGGVRSWRSILSGWIHRGQEGGDNREGEANVLLSLGNLELNVGNLKAPRTHYTQAAQLYHDLHQRREEAYALLGLGDVDRAVNNFEDARKNYGSARGLFYNDQQGEASVFLSFGGLEGTLGNTDAALWDYKRASELFGVDKLDQRDVLVGRAQLETDLGNYGDAGNDLKAASDLSRDGGDPLGEAMIREATAHLDTELGKEKKDEARENYGRARVIYAKNTDKLGEADVLLGLGKLESRFGDPKTARKDYDDAYELYRQEEIPFGEADVLYNQAELERKQKKYDQAGPDYQAARKIYEKEPLDVCNVGEANVLLGLGDLAREQGDLDEARRDYDQARRLYEDQMSLIGQANVDLSESMLPHENPGEALDRLNKAKKLYSQMGKSDNVSDVQRQLNKYKGLTASKR